GSGNGPVAVGQRHGHTFAASGQVAPDLAALGNARQAEGCGLATDHQQSLVAVHDLGQVALHHHAGRAALVERFDDRAQVHAVGTNPEDAHATHAVERLEDDVPVFGVEVANGLGRAR